MRKRSHGFDMQPGARIEALRCEVEPVIPVDLTDKGRIWYAEADDTLRFSKMQSGLLVPSKLLDNELKWKDLTAPITSGSGTGISTPNWETFRNNFAAMLFLSSKVQSVQVCFHIDHDYAAGTPIFPHIHWANKDTGDVGVVRWGVEIVLAKGHQQDNFNSTITTIYIEQQAAGGTLTHHIAEGTSGFYDTRLEPDTLIYCRVFRDSFHPNDTAGDVYGLTVDLHMQIDGIGTPSRKPNFYQRS